MRVVLVDVERDKRLPLVAHRPLGFGADGGVGWWSTVTKTAPVLVDDGGALKIVGPTGDDTVPVNVDAPFEVEHRRYRVERRDDAMLDMHFVGDTILFNASYFSPRAQLWRGVRPLGDRLPLDVVILDGKMRMSRSSYGVPVDAIVSMTESQRATMDDDVAAALALPLLTNGRRANEVAITWDGVVESLTVARWAPDHEAAVRTFCRLANRPRPPLVNDDDVEELRAIKPASTERIAEVVRALFADDWAVEAELREQLEML